MRVDFFHWSVFSNKYIKRIIGSNIIPKKLKKNIFEKLNNLIKAIFIISPKDFFCYITIFVPFFYDDFLYLVIKEEIHF